MNYAVELKNISTIRAGDLIRHEGIIRTVSANNIKYNSFMGTTIFGDSYSIGNKLVEKIVLQNASK
jgi:hypothetical protein